MSWFSSWAHPGRAYDRAGKEANKYYQQGQQQRQPFIDMGQQAGQSQMEQLQKLLHPEQLQDEWSKNYHESEYAKNLKAQNQTSGLDAASAMGELGSSSALANIQQGAGNIENKDRQQYMDDMMQKYMMASGIGQNMYNTGANMTTNQANATDQFGNNMAAIKFNQNQAGGNQFNQMMAAIAAAMSGGGSQWKNPGSLPGWGNK